MKKILQRGAILALIILIIVTPMYLFRDPRRYAPLVLTLWLLLAVTYVFTRRIR